MSNSGRSKMNLHRRSPENYILIRVSQTQKYPKRWSLSLVFRHPSDRVYDSISYSGYLIYLSTGLDPVALLTQYLSDKYSSEETSGAIHKTIQLQINL